MKIQKGIVKYKDRNDIVCAYGVADDGTQYYFLDENDEKKMPNGNRVVSTALVEAVDSMVKATHIGVIDGEGNVVIPFENKAIKPVGDTMLIVEKAFPTSQNVLDAIEKRSDTVAAPTLVSTSAAIKDKMNAKMGAEGRFLVNDQFSEATVCDIDGNNLLNNEYYSFIGISNDELYLSKNSVDSPIVRFSISQGSIIEDKGTDMIDVQSTDVDPSSVENALADEGEKVSVHPDDENVVVPDSAVTADEIKMPVDIPLDGTMASDEKVPFVDVNDVLGSTRLDIPPVVGEDDNNVNNEVVMPPVVDAAEVAQSVGALDEMEGKEESEEEVAPVNIDDSMAPPSDVGISPMDFAPPVDAVESTKEDDSLSKDNEENVDIPTGFVPPADDVVGNPSLRMGLEESSNFTPEEERVLQEDVMPMNNLPEPEAVVPEMPVEETAAVPEVAVQDVVVSPDLAAREEEVQFNKNVISIDPNVVASTVDKDSNGILDSSEIIPSHRNEIPMETNSHHYDIDDIGRIDDIDKIDSYGTSRGTDTLMSDVVRSMSELMRQNREQKSTISQVQSRLEDSESQRRILVERYKEQASRYDNLSSKLRSLDGLATKLETKVRDQSKIIESQNRELKALRSQLDSKQDLVKLLADARDLLGENEEYSYSDDTYYRRAS